MRIDWSGSLTKGRQTYVSVLGYGGIADKRFLAESGFVVWDRWSDGSDLRTVMF